SAPLSLSYFATAKSRPKQPPAHALELMYDPTVGRGRRHPDLVRIVAAQISGIAERCVIVHGLTEDQALVEIGEALAAIGPGQQRREALAYAVARYVDETTTAAAVVASLLQRAGADLDLARIIRTKPRSSFLMR